MLVTVVSAVTWIALEMGEVVVLRTLTPEGDARRTRVWLADEQGSLWIEAGHPAREFLADIRREPNVEIERGDSVQPYRAHPREDPQSRDKVRALMREKYGWADRWVAALFDTARSIAIRLEPRKTADRGRTDRVAAHACHMRCSELRLA
jgi:hypothetical protein